MIVLSEKIANTVCSRAQASIIPLLCTLGIAMGRCHGHGKSCRYRSFLVFVILVGGISVLSEVDML